MGNLFLSVQISNERDLQMGRKQCNIQGDKVRQAVESMEGSCRGRQSSDYKRQEGRQLGFKERLGKVG